ncbi:ROK family protein [Geobacter sp. DSM 9736]|uniref:ROK family protein n=1 Tax=Geobacter sp. DSM 9736 TaxID=1277350 RepID=UPI000B60FA89|nr:ROK family protein [Geobacter sp. DSM 9736]SNB46724.1 fructokinase [Geobacter sp. DSM 9736]
MMEPYRVGIDVGGSKIEAVLLAPEGGEITRRRVASPSRSGYGAMLDSIVHLFETVRDGIPSGASFTIGIGIPGSINGRTGLVQNANSTCLIGQPLQRDIEARIGRRVAIDNDANCFVLAEAVLGSGRGYDLVFGVIMGTGCGGGLFIEGQVRPGPHRIAGEWGHFSVDPAGASCYCGNRGCVETKISGSGVEAAFRAAYGEELSMELITEGWRSREPRCVAIFDRFLDDFGRSLGGLISVLDPDAVVLGGGLSNIDELYTEGVDRVRKYVFHGDLRTPILKNSLGDSAGVLGAAWIGE